MRLFEKWADYYGAMAQLVAMRSSCVRYKVGVVIVHPDNYVLSTGYNGTPSGLLNCNEGGCLHCNSDDPSHVRTDACLCVHAESNAIAFAARSGTSLAGAILYSTTRPCFTCLKLIYQAGIQLVIFEHTVPYAPELELHYFETVSNMGLELIGYPLSVHVKLEECAANADVS